MESETQQVDYICPYNREIIQNIIRELYETSTVYNKIKPSKLINSVVCKFLDPGLQ